MARYVVVIIAIVIAAAVGIGYSAFFYVQDAGKEPVAVDAAPAVIRIVEGASSESNPEFMVPRVATVVAGVNNTVRWINEDTVPHGIVSDSGYVDPVSGLFDSQDLTNDDEAFVMPGKSYEFTFTEPGEYGYHHVPHPWVQGTIIVREQ